MHKTSSNCYTKYTHLTSHSNKYQNRKFPIIFGITIIWNILCLCFTNYNQIKQGKCIWYTAKKRENSINQPKLWQINMDVKARNERAKKLICNNFL